MDNQQPTTPNQSMPAWFADGTSITPPTPKRASSKKYLPFIIGIAVILAVVGSIAWYIIAVNSAKTEAFQRFRDSYEQLETELANFDDITEPENLSSDELASSWKSYQSAFTALSTTSIYKDNQQLIEEIRSSSLAYEAYVTIVIPSLARYLSECYVSGDETMYGAACQGYIQTAIDSKDKLTSDSLSQLLAVLVQSSQDNTLSQASYDSILDLQEKIFAVGRTIQDTVRPKVIEFGKEVGVEMPATEPE